MPSIHARIVTLGLTATAALATLAGAAPKVSIIHTTDPAHPSSFVPGAPGLQFGNCGEGFGAPAVSADGQQWLILGKTNSASVGHVLVTGNPQNATTILTQTQQAPWLFDALVGDIREDYAINAGGEIAALVSPRGRDQVVVFDPTEQRWMLEAEAGGCLVDQNMRPLGDEFSSVQISDFGAVGFVSRLSLAAPVDPNYDLREAAAEVGDPLTCTEARDDLVVVGRKIITSVGSVLVSPDLEGPTVTEVLAGSLRVAPAYGASDHLGAGVDASMVFGVSVDPGDGAGYEMIAHDGIGVANTGSYPAPNAPTFGGVVAELLDLSPSDSDSSITALVLDGQVVAQTGGSLPSSGDDYTTENWIAGFTSADAGTDGVLVAGYTSAGETLWHSRHGALLRTGDRIDMSNDRASDDPTIVTGFKPGWVIAGGKAFGIVTFHKPISETEGEAFLSIDATGCVGDISSATQPGVPDGNLTAADMFHFGDLFRQGDMTADLSSPQTPGVPDGRLTGADFFYFLDLFSKGCDDGGSNPTDPN